MEYAEIRNILYGSREIAQIPDKWEESVPFRCVLDGTEYDAFLYWVTASGKAELRRMICIESETGKIRTLDGGEIIGRFGLSGPGFSPAPITDYDAWFRAKDGYELFYASFCRQDEDIDYAAGGRLLRTLLGDDCLRRILAVPAKDYIKRLSAV